MTKLLDLLEYYLRWRQELPGGQGMQYRCGAGGGLGGKGGVGRAGMGSSSNATVAEFCCCFQEGGKTSHLSLPASDKSHGRPCTHRRIDGSTPLEDREVAIQEFNRAGSNVFIFLLSIRAAGRGLNLQVHTRMLPHLCMRRVLCVEFVFCAC